MRGRFLLRTTVKQDSLSQYGGRQDADVDGETHSVTFCIHFDSVRALPTQQGPEDVSPAAERARRTITIRHWDVDLHSLV
jgi:hypothetical protein